MPNELSEFLKCNHIDHITSSPNSPQSNGFIEWQVRTIKTVPGTTQESSKSLDKLLLDPHSTPIGPNMPFPRKILHSRSFQHPRKPSTPVDMEHVHNFQLLRKQSQKQHFYQAHNAKELQQLDLGQEVLVLSPAENEYYPATIVYKASTPCSYIIEAQGKCYHRNREHTRPIHLNIFQQLPLNLQSKPHIPKHPHNIKHFPNENSPSPLPKIPSLFPHSHIPRPLHLLQPVLLLVLYPPHQLINFYTTFPP